VPPRKRVLSCADVAQLLGWRTERARRWIRRHDIGFQVGSRWFTTPTKLRDAFPEVYTEIATELVEAHGPE